MPSVCFTSPKRVIKDLDYFEKNGLNSQITVCRELTKKFETIYRGDIAEVKDCLLYTSPSPRDGRISRMPSSA